MPDKKARVVFYNGCYGSAKNLFFKRFEKINGIKKRQC
jgi:hypothetical protein